MSSTLKQLAAHSIIVADSGDLDALKATAPQDATTNPSLILKAAKIPKFQYLIDEAVAFARTKPAKEQMGWAIDRVNVNFGEEISKIVPGYISTEMDAQLSFKPKRTANRARRVIQMYKDKGVDTSRVLIKIAATWQGIQAAAVLEKEGIKCNLTLVFNEKAQAWSAAQAGVFLISPFVGRIGDYYKAKGQEVAGDQDPGVKVVKEIDAFYKENGIKTIVMAASLRSVEQTVALAGCDRLTIPPKVISALASSKASCPKALTGTRNPVVKEMKYLDDRHWYMRMCRDPMATVKLQEGIMGFVRDTKALEKLLKSKLSLPSKL